MPTWTTSRRTTNAWSCGGRVSRSNRGSISTEFGVRSEVNVFVDANGGVHVTGGLQTEVLPILAATKDDESRKLPGQDSNLEKQDQNLL